MIRYNERQEAILRFLEEQKTASRAAIEQHIARLFPEKNSKVTILRDLDLLLGEGKITKTGKARGVEYAYSGLTALDEVDVDAYFAVDPDDRTLKSEYFNFDVWGNLQNLLTENEKQELALLNRQFRDNKKALSAAAFQKELERLTIEFSWKSSKIEGDTYSLLDTERLITEHIEAKGKKREEAVMILNHKTALDYIYQQPDFWKTLGLAKIEDIHRLLVMGLEVSFGIRKNRVGITGTTYRPLENSFQIKEALEELVNRVNAASDPVEKALIAVLGISYIQPFEDGNKRTARILGNAVLLAHDYCPLSYRSVDEVEYKKGVILFYEQNSVFYFKKIFIEQFSWAVEKYF
jgi:fido (protein-threonine AMPylation protein)